MTQLCKKKNIDIVEIAKKQRHLRLLEKVRKNKRLTPGELDELQDYEGGAENAQAVLKNRYVHILEKVKQGDALTAFELKELEHYEKITRKSKKAVLEAPYLSERESQRRLMRRKRAEGRDITIPACRNPRRRRGCQNDWEKFCKTYFAEVFFNRFTKDQRAIGDSIANGIKDGTYQAIAAARGDGKSSIVKVVGGVWAMVYGLIHYIAILQATGPFAEDMLTDIKEMYEFSPLLAADFPEVCVPIQELEGAPQRAGGQTANGQRTLIKWEQKRIILPTVEVDGRPSPASGNLIITRGIDAAVRGLVKKDKRPDLVICDDLETPESVLSIVQTKKIQRKIELDILGLQGPSKPMAVIVLGTILRRGSVMDMLTDRKQSPQYHGIRQKLLVKKPAREDLWSRYVELRKEGQATGDKYGRTAHKFYLKNREEMDEGAAVNNPYRFAKRRLPDKSWQQVSALQACYDKIADMGGWDNFATEYQNEPAEDILSTARLEQGTVFEKISGMERRHVPAETLAITRFVDVHDATLFYADIAWRAGANGYIVDYGTEAVNSPVRGTVTAEEKEAQVDIAIFGALTALRQKESETGFVRPDTGEIMHLSMTFVDSGYKPEPVYRFCRQFVNVMAAKGGGGRTGRYLHPRQPRSDGTIKMYAGLETLHLSYQLTAKIWLAVLDPDKFKTQAQEGFKLADAAAAGSISIFAGQSHRAFAEHICAEFWNPEKMKYERISRNNHWLDCTAGCCAAAAMLGIRVGQAAEAQKAKKTIVRKKTNFLDGLPSL